MKNRYKKNVYRLDIFFLKKFNKDLSNKQRNKKKTLVMRYFMKCYCVFKKSKLNYFN